jgi:hypothetical protein
MDWVVGIIIGVGILAFAGLIDSLANLIKRELRDLKNTLESEPTDIKAELDEIKRIVGRKEG